MSTQRQLLVDRGVFACARVESHLFKKISAKDYQTVLGTPAKALYSGDTASCDNDANWSKSRIIT